MNATSRKTSVNFKVYGFPRLRCLGGERLTVAAVLFLGFVPYGRALGETAPPTRDARRATQELHEYFRRVTENRAAASMQHLRSLRDWEAERLELRGQLLEMLGLSPLPEKTPLRPTVTGTVERDGIVVEKLHFQSQPGLYVTANFYRPKEVTKPLPTILYVCGHGQVKMDGVSYGNKVKYHHHAVWFAHHGYCCLVIDTLQLGEIEGQHHGTYRLGRWWWISRGYTPAGVEAWNGVRALDYLETRPEVDMSRLGVTGRSGGGIYTWWLAAIDDRPRCLVPVAGITDLENYVVDHCIEGHCDCMFMVNTYGWDFPLVAALSAPRPTLFSNSDKDTIFPLSGVIRAHDQLRSLHELYAKNAKGGKKGTNQLGLLITEGPHSDTQELQVPAFRWMNRWLRESDALVREPAEPLFTPQELKVFAELPTDERNTTLDETFVPAATDLPSPSTKEEWEHQAGAWLTALQQQSLRGWPAEAPAPRTDLIAERVAEGLRLRILEFTSDENLRFPVYLLQGARHERPELLVVTVMDTEGFEKWRTTFAGAFGELLPGAPVSAPDAKGFASEQAMMDRFPWAFAVVAPRGWGPNAWEGTGVKYGHLLRRFVLLGKTADEGRIWDVRRAIAMLREREDLSTSRVWLQGEGDAAGIALYAGLFEPAVERFDLHRPPTSHRESPILMNVLKTLDMPQALALAFPRRVLIHDSDPSAWTWSEGISRLFDSAKPPLEFRSLGPKDENAGR